MRTGQASRTSCRAGAGSGVQAIGVMHSAMPEMAAALDLVRRHWRGPMLAYPEAGWFEMPDWRFIEVDPEGFADAGAGLGQAGCPRPSAGAAVSGPPISGRWPSGSDLAECCPGDQELPVRGHVVDPQELHALLQRPEAGGQGGGQALLAASARGAPPSSPCARRPAGAGSPGRGAAPGGGGRRDCAARAWRSTSPGRRSAARAGCRPPSQCQMRASSSSYTSSAGVPVAGRQVHGRRGSPRMCMRMTPAPLAAAAARGRRDRGSGR